jgi:hypothetical protein
MDNTGQTLVFFGMLLVLMAAVAIWAIRDRSTWRKRATGFEFDRIERLAHTLEENLLQLDGRMERIEGRLDRRSSWNPREVRAIRSDLACRRRELAHIASVAERGAIGTGS